MKKLFTLLLFIIISLVSISQTITNVENIYGGRINAIASSKITGTTDSFNIFITTESANTAFYAKAKASLLSAANISSFTKMPALTATAGVGSGIQKIAAFNSYLYYLGTDNVIYKTAFNSSSKVAFKSFGADSSINDFLIKDSRIWYFFKKFSTNLDGIAYSDLDGNGDAINYTSPYSYNNTVYPAKNSFSYNLSDSITIFKEGNDPELTILTNVTTGTSSFIHDNLSTLSSSIYWKCVAIAPDGRVVIGGSDNTKKYIAYKDTTTSVWTVVNTGINGTFGSNIAFYENIIGSNYYVYFGSAYSNNKGNVSSWNNFGNTSLETHSNDGYSLTLASTISGGVVLITTDQGLGWTKNSGPVITEIDNGIEAVQVNDFDMRKEKDFGWLSSKAGVRYVSNYNTSSKVWSNAMFPNGDGSPYFSSEMIGNDSMSAYVGNVRVYKTTTKGSSWSKVFTAEDAPYNFPAVGSQVTSIAVSDSVNNIVLVGYKILGTQRGGVFYTTNGGTSWDQLLIYATTKGQDVDVNDIEITSDSGKVVAYIGVDYDNSVTPYIRGMYKAQWNGTSWSVRAEEIYAPTTTLINVNDIVIHSRDTIVATGGFYNTVYAKEYGISFMISRPIYNSWTSYTQSSRNSGYTACAWNGDTLFYAYKDSILYSKITFSSTGTGTPGEALYSTVDKGTEINVLYYDELLAGSSTKFSSIKGAEMALPLHITLFTANEKNNAVLLNWRNEWDEDVSQYILEGSCNGVDFSVLTNIASNKQKNYSYEDVSSCNTKTKYYRLKVVSNNGNVEYSKVIKIGSTKNNTISIYPNPATTGIFYLQSAINADAQIKVYDVLGREKYSTINHLNGMNSINISHLAKGTYFLQITINGNTVTKTIIF